MDVSQDYIDQETVKKKEEIDRRLQVYRGDRKPLNLKGEIVILVDDGIATGATMEAAIASVKSQKPEKIIIGVPVAPPAFREKIKNSVDEVVCCLEPENLYAVGQFYQDFAQVDDAEVVRLMQPQSHNRL